MMSLDRWLRDTLPVSSLGSPVAGGAFQIQLPAYLLGEHAKTNISTFDMEKTTEADKENKVHIVLPRRDLFFHQCLKKGGRQVKHSGCHFPVFLL